MNLKKYKLLQSKMPKHIAYIIDGNGRWATKKGLERSVGHKFGMKTLVNAINNAFELGIDYISIYGFSTENWNRPKEEVEYLFELFEEFVKKDFSELIKFDVKLNIMGDYKQFPKSLVNEIEKKVEQTKSNTDKVLNLGINYGGRDEIVRAVNEIIKTGVKSVTKDGFSNYLYTKSIPDPDFIIRTSGEQRISNFMLWQNAYSEFYFPKTLWPDFSKRHLIKALRNYQKRNRRFGKIKENK